MEIVAKIPSDRKLVATTVVGSNLFGTNIKDSDIDIVFTFISSMGESLLKTQRESIRINMPNIKDDIVGHNFLDIINQYISGDFGRLAFLFDFSNHPNDIVKKIQYRSKEFSDIIIKNRHLFFTDLFYEKCIKQSHALFHQFYNKKNYKTVECAIRNLMFFF